MLNFYTNNLHVGYENAKKQTQFVLENVNVALQPNKLTVLLGLNGVGKSTLLRVLSGLQTHYQGEVMLNNVNLRQYSLLEKARQISVVLTEKLQNNQLTVAEIVSLGRTPYTNWAGALTTKDKEIINQCLQITHTDNLANRYLHTLSDGQLQKALIARALAQESNLLLLDEPTAHLDLCNKAEIWHLLQIITHEQQKTVLLTSHDIDFALQLADIIWLIHQKKVYSFTPQELLANKMLENVFQSKYFSFDKGMLRINL
jgi:iron complex transport system ATP-binding protein